MFNLTLYYGGNNVNAVNNYWDTVNELKIQNLIWDKTDELGGDDVGTVYYYNWLDDKVNNAGLQQ